MTNFDIIFRIFSIVERYALYQLFCYNNNEFIKMVIKMKIALAQLDIKWEDKNFNIIKCEKFIKEASYKGCSIIIFPEMTLTGFSMNTSIIGEDIDGFTVTSFKKFAKENKIAVCFGYVKNNNRKALNEMIIVDKNGLVVSKYDKIHPFSYGEESKYYEGGKSISTCNIDEFNIGSFICYDLRFPEVFQASSKINEIIFLIANWPKERIEAFNILLRARAIENQCYIAAVNRVGESDGLNYNGYSQVVDPLGNVLISENKCEKLIICDILKEKVFSVRRNFSLKEDRREEIYKEFY